MRSTTERVLVAIVTGVAVTDVTLIRRGHPALSTVIRSSRARRAAVAFLAAHLLGSWRYDPLHLLADWLTPKRGEIT